MIKIFDSYYDFLQREDKDINGVSPSFAEAYPEFEKDNESNKGCWNCSDCSDCSRCSGCSGCSRCSDCSDCSDCSRCSRCSDCSDCSDCSRCSRCSDCSGCSRCSDCSDCSDCSRCSGCSRLELDESVQLYENVMGNYPVIENIHQKVFDTASQPKALNMSDWHTCDTTHCRAGWVVHLAGEAGAKLERQTSTLFAAMQIYKASSPIQVSPVRFYESNEVALEDMKRCADEEQNPAKGAVDYNMEPNTKQPDELKKESEQENAQESLSQDQAMEATQDSEKGSTEG